MDEEIIIDLFNRAKSKGYNKSIEDFKLLLETDEDVILDNFNYVKSKGYNKTIDDFKILVKKKDETTELDSPQEEVVTTSVTEEVETPGVSDVSISDEVVETTQEPTIDTQEFIEQTTQEVVDNTQQLPNYIQRATESRKPNKAFDEDIATVVLDDIDKEEEILVPELRTKFNKYGFTFDESSVGDAVTVFDYDGNPLEIDLQPFTSSGKQQEYNKLIQFLTDNKRDPEQIKKELDVESERFKDLAEQENKDIESSLLFPQVKTTEASGAIQTGLIGVVSSLFSSPDREDDFIVRERTNKYITSGGKKYKQQEFDRLFEEKVKALEIGDDGKPSEEDIKQAAYDAKIQQRVNIQKDFINTLSPGRKALAEALTAVREAQRAGVSNEEVNFLKQKFNDLYNQELGSTKKLYNFDGTYIEEGNAPEEVVNFNNQVEQGSIDKYESYTPEELEKLQVDLLYKTVFSAKKINDHADKIYEDLGFFVEGPFQSLKAEVKSLIDGDLYNFGYNLGGVSIATDEIKKVAETGRITETLPLLPGHSPLVQEYNNNVKQLLEIQGALALNYNPSTLEEGDMFTPIKAFAVSAYEASTGQNVRLADDMVKAYVSAREDAGLKVTEKDKQRAEDSILDEGMAATGTIVPLIAEIAITKKAINLTRALKNMKVLTRYAQMQTRNPYKRFAIGTVSAGLQEALVFKSTGVLADQLIAGSGEGMTGAMGFGFGVGGYAGGIITKALLGTRSPILQAALSPLEKSLGLRSVFNGTANAIVGTGALYGAEFFDAMVNSDKGFSEAAAEVLDIEGSPLKKLLVSLETMGALGLGNRKGWKNIYEAMRQDIKNYKPMTPSEYSKAVETLGLDPKKEYTAEEIKTAYKNKSKESHPDRGGSNEAFIEVKEAYDKLTTNEAMLLEQQNIRNQEGYKKKRREMFFMANRMKNQVEFRGKDYELDYRDAELIKDLSNTQLEVLTQDLKNQGISGQDAFALQGKVQTARNHLKTINEVGITDPAARKRVYDLLNKFTEADRKLEELKNKAKTSKANEALFSEQIKRQEAEVNEITDNLQKEITKSDKEVSVTEPTEGVLRLEGKEPVEVEPTEVKEEVVTEEVVEETPTTEVTEEVKIDKDAITTNTSVETNRIKELDVTAEDGQTFNLDGTTYEAGGLVVPVMSINTTQSEITPEKISDFVQENQDKIGDAGVVKVGIYKFPGSNQVSIDLNIVVPSENRDVALEFGRLAGQESLFDLETFENVKTGSDGKNPLSFTGEQFKEIAKSLKDNKLPEVFETPTTEVKEEIVEETPTEEVVAEEVIEETPVAEEVVEEKPKIEKEFPKPKMIKTINKIIKSVVKPKISKSGRPIVRLSIPSQVKLYEVAATLEGLDLKEMPIEQVKVLYDNILAIEKQGKVDKKLSDRAKNIARSKRKGTVAEGLYEEGPVKEKGVELNSIEEAEDFLDKSESGDRLIVIDGSLVTNKKNLKLFLEANPDIPIENIKGYETLTMTRAKRNQPIPSKLKKGAALIFDPTKSVANIRTQFMRIGKGSPKLKKITEDILDDITTNNPYEVEVLTEQLYKKYEKIFTDNFRSKKEANRYLDKRVKGLFKDSDAEMSNGTVVDLYIEQIIHKERAEFFREKASKEKSEKEKKALLRDADRMDRILEISDIDSKAFNEYVEKNPKIKKVGNSLLNFYESNTELFRPLIEAETGMPLRIKKYYTTYRNDESLENKEYKQASLEELTNPEVEFFNRSAMTDRLKFKDERNTKKIKTNVDARLKAQDYIHNMVHAQVYLPTARKVNELFGPATRGKIYEKIGPTNFKYTQENLDYIIDPKLSNPYDQALKVANKLNRLGITLQLGFSLGNITKQVTSFTHFAFVGGKDGISPQNWAETFYEIPFNKEYKKVALDIITSKYVRDRIRKSNIDPDLKIEADKALSSKGEKAWNFYQKIAMSPITFGDIGGVLIGGVPFAVAKYKKVKTTPKGEFDEKAYEKAYKRFRTESSEAQQSSAEFTISAAQRNQAMKLLLTYRTAQIQAFNKSMQGWIDMTDKSNDSKDRWDGFKRWAYFSTTGIWFQAVANGALYKLLISSDGSDEEKKEKSWEQIVYDSLSGGLESYIQGMGGVAYLPQVLINLAKGRPPQFNLPPLVSKFYQAGSLGMTLVKMVLEQKSWDDLTDKQKKSVSGLLFKKGSEIIESISEGEPGKIIEMLLNKGKDYGDPSFETLFNGQEFKLKEFKTIPVNPKKNKSTKLQELLGEPKKTTVIKEEKLEEVDLEEVDLEEVELED